MDDVWDAFDGQPHRVRMGTHPLDTRDWTSLPATPALTTELDRKAAVVRAHPDAVALLPGERNAHAADELLGRLVAHLVSHQDGRYRRTREGVTLEDDGRSWRLPSPNALQTAGSMVPEDWCLVVDGVLVGATLCSPNRWRLAEKLGRTMREVHAPVPGYETAVGSAVDRLLAGAGRPVVRLNWSIQTSPERWQPWPAPAQDGLWVRSERETLVPLTDGWVFGIRTRIRPLADVPDDAKPRVRTAVESLDPETADYKEIAPFREALLAQLS